MIDNINDIFSNYTPYINGWKNLAIILRKSIVSFATLKGFAKPIFFGTNSPNTKVI